MQDDIDIRLAFAREGLASLPPTETRAHGALAVLDRYRGGTATLQQLAHASDACRRGFKAYAHQAKQERSAAAKARVKGWCVAMFAVYDVVDRVLDDRESEATATTPVFHQVVAVLFGWLWRAPVLPQPEPQPYRTAAVPEPSHNLAWWRRAA